MIKKIFFTCVWSMFFARSLYGMQNSISLEEYKTILARKNVPEIVQTTTQRISPVFNSGACIIIWDNKNGTFKKAGYPERLQRYCDCLFDFIIVEILHPAIHGSLECATALHYIDILLGNGVLAGTPTANTMKRAICLAHGYDPAQYKIEQVTKSWKNAAPQLQSYVKQYIEHRTTPHHHNFNDNHSIHFAWVLLPAACVVVFLGYAWYQKYYAQKDTNDGSESDLEVPRTKESEQTME